MAYAILRFKKLKTTSSIAKSLRHTLREVAVPNADPKAPAPWIGGPRSTAQTMAKMRERWPAKRRKDAVLAVEYLITASPEAFRKHGGQLDETSYFNAALKYLQDRHGAENVVQAAVHRDESSPHLVVYVIPLRDGRLNAKSYFDGSKGCSQLQTEFWERCGQPHGLERGIQGSKAKHTTIRQFYTSAKRAGAIPELTKADLAAAAMGVKTDNYKRVEKASRDAANASTLAHLRERAAQSRAKALERQETALAGREKDVERRLGMAATAIERGQRMESAVTATINDALAGERRKAAEAQKAAQAAQEQAAQLRAELAESKAAQERLAARNNELQAKLPKPPKTPRPG